jgi:hypothetical protein
MFIKNKRKIYEINIKMNNFNKKEIKTYNNYLIKF